MDKERMNYLVGLADLALRESGSGILNTAKAEIKDSYNGLVAAFPVSIAMSGLKPAFCFYYQKSDSGNSKTSTKPILNTIAWMLDRIAKDPEKETPFDANQRSLLNNLGDIDKLKDKIFALKENTDEEVFLKALIIDCSTALKLVVRTYKLTSNGKSA